MASGQMPVIRPPALFVDSAESLGNFLQDLCHRINNKDYSSQGPTLYIDLEGINLCRHGSVFLLAILIRERKEEYDENWEPKHHIEESVDDWDEGFSGVGTLKEVLESPDTHKILFDVRNDADALFAHFGIHLRGTMDLQLLENLKRHQCHENAKFVHGLARCIREDSRLSTEKMRAWEDAKQKGTRMFAPQKGGRYAVFYERPLNRDILIYCVQDVLCTLDLWQVYSQMLRSSYTGSLYPSDRAADLRRKIKTATKMRVKDVESASYDPYS